VSAPGLVRFASPFILASIRYEASNTISAWKPASIRSEQKQDFTMSLPTIIFCHGAYHPKEISARSLGFLNP